MLDAYNLRAAAADNVITRTEAAAAGLDYDRLEIVARKGGASDVVDSYDELASARVAAPIVATTAAQLAARVASADYIVIARRSSAEVFSPLINHRAATDRQAVLVDPDDIVRLYGVGPDGVRRLLTAAHAEGPRARFVFLMDGGAADDASYGDPDANGTLDYHVGRMPLGTSNANVAKYVSRLLAYEATLPPALWQIRTTLVDGDPMWGAFLANVIDWYAAREMESFGDDAYLKRYSLNPQSDLNAHGIYDNTAWASLLIGYVGHGLSGPQDNVAGVPRDPVRDGFPIMFFLSCQDGGPGGAASKVLNGPAVTAIGSTQNTDSIANAQLSAALGHEVIHGKAPTIGETFDAAKHRAESGKVNFWAWLLRLFVNIGSFFSRLFGGDLRSVSDSVAADNRTYSLFGDPAMNIRRPLRLRDVGFRDVLRPGHPATPEMTLPAGMKNGFAIMTLERPIGEAPLEDTTDASLTYVEKVARLQRNLQRYNQRVVATMRVEIRDAKPVGPVQVPAGIREGSYLLRVAVVGEADVATAVVSDYPVASEQPTEWFGGL